MKLISSGEIRSRIIKAIKGEEFCGVEKCLFYHECVADKRDTDCEEFITEMIEKGFKRADGIILKGIDLPKDCTECPLEGAEVDDDGFDYWYCKITESMATTIERPSNCPLIQIPKDHGNLKDVDAIYRAFSKCAENETDEGKMAVYAQLMKLLLQAPTILEAEG